MPADMSAEAIGRRLKIMGELWELSVALMSSKIAGSTSEGVGSLVESFCDAAIEKGDLAHGKRDAELYDEMCSAFHKLKRCGAAGSKALEELLEHESVYVRLWVASALLIERNMTARKVLEQVAGGKRGPVRLGAEMVLEEFDRGNLRTVFVERD